MTSPDIPLRLRAADSFGSEDDLADPRTPEQRTKRVSDRFDVQAWHRLRYVAAINASAALLLPVVTTASGAVFALSEGLLAIALVVALNCAFVLRPRPRTRVVLPLIEALCAACAIAIANVEPNVASLLLGAMTLSAGALLRRGAASWIHAVVLGLSLVIAGFSSSILAGAGIVVLAALALVTIRDSTTSARQQLRQEIELEELSALCAALSARAHALHSHGMGLTHNADGPAREQ